MLLGIACLLGALLLLCIILIITTSVTAKVRYDGEAEIKIKYLFFTIVRSPESPSQIRKKKRQKKKEAKRRLRELKKKEKLRRRNRRAAHLKTKKRTPPRKAVPTESIAFSAEKSAAENEGEKAVKAQVKTSGNIKDGKAKADKKAKVDFQAAMRIFNSAKPHIKKLFKKIRISDVFVDIMVGGDDAAKTAISYGVHCSAIYGLAEFLKQSVTFKAERITIRADFDLPKTDYYASATLKLKLSTFLGCLLWGFLAITKEINKENPQAGKQHKVKNQPLKKAG